MGAFFLSWTREFLNRYLCGIFLGGFDLVLLLSVCLCECDGVDVTDDDWSGDQSLPAEGKGLMIFFSFRFFFRGDLG